MNEQKQYRDNLERELNIADGMVRVGGVSGEQSGIISASDDSDDAPGICISLSAQKVRPYVSATPRETMDAARLLVGTVMDVDPKFFDAEWLPFITSITERRNRIEEP